MSSSVTAPDFRTGRFEAEAGARRLVGTPRAILFAKMKALMLAMLMAAGCEAGGLLIAEPRIDECDAGDAGEPDAACPGDTGE